MADNTRNYIIDRLLSKRTTIEEFNFETLQAPPLSMFLDPWDIAELHSIATSLKLSGKPKERYKAIDDVMRRRGMVKFGAGTNRVVYRHPEFNDILFKVAADDVGLGDNPAEFRNQMILKPFVAKTFEISPCGTVAIVERVMPIRNREEFISVAEDVFELINTWLIGKYILADFGSRYFMNFGIRSAFGVVLLDYPYLYELDGAKLFCHAPDMNSPSGYCDGEIDYDDGYNYLYCKRCGVKYKAKELAKKIDSKMITIKERGVISMNITVSGGSKNVSKQVSKDSFLDAAAKEVTGKAPVKVTPTRPVVRMGVPNAEESATGLKISTNRQPAKKEREKTVNGVTVNSASHEIKPSKKEPEVENKKVEKKEATPAVYFGEKMCLDLNANPGETPVYDIEKAVETIVNSIGKIAIKDIKDKTVEDMLDRLISSEKIDSTILGKLVIKLLSKIMEENDEIATKDIADEILDKFYDFKTKLSILQNGVYIDASYKFSKSGKSVVYDSMAVPEETINELVEKYGGAVKTEEPEEEEQDKSARGIAWYNCKKINIKEILPETDEACDALIIYDDDGKYLTDDNSNLVLVDRVDNMDIDSYEMVPRNYLQNVVAQADEMSKNPMEEEQPEEEVKEAPVGSLPPQQPQDVEQSMAEFVEAESKSSEE